MFAGEVTRPHGEEPRARLNHGARGPSWGVGSVVHDDLDAKRQTSRFASAHSRLGHGPERALHAHRSRRVPGLFLVVGSLTSLRHLAAACVISPRDADLWRDSRASSARR